MKIIRINKDGSMNELELKIPKNPINILNRNKIEKIDEVISDLNNVAPFFSNQWNNLN